MSHLNTSLQHAPVRTNVDLLTPAQLLRSLLLPVMMLLAPLAWGQIFSNPITGTDPGLENPYTTGQSVDPNLTVTGIGRTGVNGNAANNRYNTNGWNVGSLDAGKYIHWTLTPNSGYGISFTDFIYTGQASATGPTNVALRSSLDGYTSDIGSPSITGTTIDLSGAAFQNLNGPITFRLYAWGASLAGGTFSINDFEFNGTVCSSATINYAGDPYCNNSGTATVSRTGPGSGTYAYTGPGTLQLNTSNGAVTLGTSDPGTYTVTYTTPGGCPFNASTSITVTQAPNFTFSYPVDPYCSDEITAVPNTSGVPTGGTFSNIDGLVFDPGTGAVDLIASPPGSYTVAYNVGALGGCTPYGTTADITIELAPSATIDYAGPFCSSDAAVKNVTQTGTGGGTYSYTGSGTLDLDTGTGDIDPSGSDPGTYTVTYTIAATAACAEFTTTASVTITEQPAATMSYDGSPYCNAGGAAAVTFNGTAGGSFSSTGGLDLNTTTGEVDLNASTPGSYTVIYTVIAAGGCALFSTEASIAITATPVWYLDQDGDGSGDPNNSVAACVQPVGYVANDLDNCPTDPNKQAPGACGCFVAEGDCEDGCDDVLAINYDANPLQRFADCLYCGELQDFDNDDLTLGLTQAPDTWYRDRYVPYGFAGGVSFGGRDALKHSIDASDCESCRPGGFNGAFYNTQGRKYDLPAETKEMSIELYIPADWATTGRRMAGLWATAVNVSNSISAYPILEFASDGVGPRFQYWNGSGWTNMGLPNDFDFDDWTTLRIALLPNAELLFQVGDDLRHTSTAFSAAASVRMSDVMLQGYNNAVGVTYDIHWDNLLYFHEDTDTDGDGVGDACDFCPTLADYDSDGPVQNTTQGTYHCTIQAAIDAADPNDVILVAAGTYAENLEILKAIDLRGPNYGVSGNSPLRVAEAIIHPATTGVFVYNVDVDADDVRIDGFLLDGDNPDLTSGFTNTTAADIDGASAIDAYFGGSDRLVVQNNIIRNYFYQAVTIYPYFNSGNGGAGTPSSGHIIADNLFEDLGTYDTDYAYFGWGGAVLVHNNAYAKVENNVMNNVRGGVQTGNYYQPTPDAGFDHGIRGNEITTRRRGIFHNLAYSNASLYPVENNAITGLMHAYESVWDGILLSSLSVPASATDNTVYVGDVTNPSEGIEVWNVAASNPVAISGGSITGTDLGVFLNNFEGYGENATSGAHATISGVSINANNIGIRVLDSPSSTTHANVQATVTHSFIVGGADGVKLEETVAGTVTGTVNNNSITGQSNKAIDATTITNTVAATCNWYGSTDPLSVAAAIAGDVSFLPYLTNGSDDDADPLTGFQPVSGACDGAGPVRVYTDATLGTLLSSHYTIQSAVDAGTTLNGHVVTVDAGSYAENVTIDKSLDIRGANYGVAGNGLRGPESIVVPGVSAAGGEIFMVETSNVSINGFTFDGDNTTLNSGWIGTNGADINAAEAITVYVAGVNNVSVTNNIIQNLGYFGVTLFGAATSNANSSKTGHLIAGNLFRDLGHYNTGNGFDSWGGGILLYNSHYTRVVDNVMTNVRIGIQTGNYQTTHVGDPQYQVIDNNSIQTRYLGVFYNLHRFSPWTISNNTITGIDNAVQAGLTTRPWRGMLLGSLGNNMGASTFSNNTIDGSGISLFATGKEGINVWNVQNNAPADFADGSISGVDIGVFLNNFEGYASNAGDGAHATISGVSINANNIGIRVLDSPSSTTHANVQATVTHSFIVGGADGVKLEETVAGTVTGTVNNNSITGQSNKAIDATTITNTVAATCNWYGSTDPLSVAAAIAGDVSFLPYLTNGSDDDADPLTGFQPVSGACDGSGPVRVYTDGTLSTLVSSHYTIQSAINSGTTVDGHVVIVDAGTYTENVNVTKAIKLYGPNAGISPNDPSDPLLPNPARVAEAVISYVAPNPANADYNNVVTLSSSAAGFELDGFTLDGLDKTVANRSGFRSLFATATDARIVNNNLINADYAIRYTSPQGVQINDNRLTEIGGTIAAIRTDHANVSTSRDDNEVKRNVIISAVVRAILLNNFNTYAKIESNVIRDAQIGIQLGQVDRAATTPGFIPTIANNDIKSWFYGIWVNQQFGNISQNTLPSTWQVTNNTIVKKTGVSAQEMWGIFVSGINIGATLNIADNTISGADHGIRLWNIASTAGVTISGGSISNSSLTAINVLTDIANSGASYTGGRATYTDVSKFPNVYTVNISGVDMQNNARGVAAVRHNGGNTAGTSSAMIAMNVQNVFIAGGTDGVHLSVNTGTPDAIQATITNNSITGQSGKAIDHGCSNTIVATCNWYGSVVEGDITALLAGPVSYQPWLVNGTDDSVAPGFQPAPGSCVGPVVFLDANALLDGPYNDAIDLMNDQLRTKGLIPTAQPYNAMPALWPPYAGGETIAAGVLNDQVDEEFDVVDWVLVELRNNATPTTVEARRAGLILRNGMIVDVDGTSPLRFPLTPDGTYRVVVRHRNHLGAMTLNGFALSAAGATVVDFETEPTWGADAQKPRDGSLMLWAGNVNRDKRLSYAGSGNDRDPILAYLFAEIPSPTPSSVVTDVYRNEDVNMDGNVKYAGSGNDRDPILVNIGSIIATAIRNEQLPE